MSVTGIARFDLRNRGQLYLLTRQRDTWKPKVFGGAPSLQASINHGTYFYHAHQEGLLANDTNIHAGIRTTLSGPSDYENDGYCGFEIVEAREIDTIGIHGIIDKIKKRVGTKKPVYLSIDIDTLDPACTFIHFNEVSGVFSF